MVSVANPSSLRKACRNCTLAKRRCIIKTPHCERCSKRGLECRYDLEPLATSTAIVYIPRPRLFGGPGDHAIHCLLNKQSSIASTDAHLSYGFMADVREGIDIVRSTLYLIPPHVVERRPFVFIHPGLRCSTKDNCLSTAIQDIRTIPEIHPSHGTFQALLQKTTSDSSLDTVLMEVQTIMLYLLAFTFCSTVEARLSALPHIYRLSHRVKDLENLASNFNARGLTPWQAWLVAESTRRTILTSHILTCVFFRYKYEIAEAKLRMEALPFDDRGGLWLAETPQAWAAAAGAKRGAEVKTNLVSWHEFGCKNPSISMDTDGDMFLSMMLVAHNGSKCLDNAPSRRISNS